MGKKRLQDETFFATKRVGRAVHEYSMLPDGCRAVVGLSGGVTSLTLLRSLLYRERSTPTTATFLPVHVPDGVHGDCTGMLKELVATWGLELTVLDPGPAAHHFAPLPHEQLLLAAARRLDAHVLALGHTILDRAYGVLMPLFTAGELAELPVVADHAGVRVIRPLCHLTDEAVSNMARAEGIPMVSPVIPYPDEALRSVVLAFMEAKKGRLIEKLRNVSNAARNIVDEYMA